MLRIEEAINSRTNSLEINKIEVFGQVMTTTLTDLQSGTQYAYRAYVSTDKSTTYGEECSFTTEGESRIYEIDQDVVKIVEVARYTIDGTKVLKPVHGINIVLYNDGSVRKEFVK